MTDDADLAFAAQLDDIFQGILRRHERLALVLPAEDAPPRSVSWADVHAAALRAGAVVAAEAHGHSMSAWESTCSGQPEAGLMAVCRHDHCSCLIYHQEGAHSVIVAGMDAPCPYSPLPPL